MQPNAAGFIELLSCDFSLILCDLREQSGTPPALSNLEQTTKQTRNTEVENFHTESFLPLNQPTLTNRWLRVINIQEK